jgi:Uma2 family endonuclease
MDPEREERHPYLYKDNSMSVSTQHDVAAIIRPPPAVPSDPIWRLSVRQYHEMIRAGILGADDPVELLDGWLVTKMTKSPPHSAATRRVRRVLEQIIPDGWSVDAQEPITLSESEPEPDVVVLRSDDRDYEDRHPGPEDVALVVEVADASLQRDRVFKRRLYAQAGIPAYWIVNLVEGRVEVYTDPSGPSDQPDYRQHRVVGNTEEVPLLIEQREVGRIAASTMLP